MISLWFPPSRQFWTDWCYIFTAGDSQPRVLGKLTARHLAHDHLFKRRQRSHDAKAGTVPTARDPSYHVFDVSLIHFLFRVKFDIYGTVFCSDVPSGTFAEFEYHFFVGCILVYRHTKCVVIRDKYKQISNHNRCGVGEYL